MDQGVKTKKARKRAPKIRGMVADAEALGVCRTHLWRVLTGQRESRSLMRRYQELQERKRKGQ